ncbi:TraR/DksA family transcriptional regulator [Catellatospora bangladeshensis]|uniref:TraR/DksA family transcriptional regulator n=1 Tax=Catellatospora bangladeshensis TaxID=310355 RepID=UPI00361CA451
MAAIGRMVRQRHEQTAAQLRGLREQSAAVIASPERGSGDAADAGTLALESAEQSLVTAALQEQLERLQVALVRLENGTLGICERCQEQVPCRAWRSCRGRRTACRVRASSTAGDLVLTAFIVIALGAVVTFAMAALWPGGA